MSTVHHVHSSLFFISHREHFVYTPSQWQCRRKTCMVHQTFVWWAVYPFQNLQNLPSDIWALPSEMFDVYNVFRLHCNERRHYNVTSSLIGWANAKDDPSSRSPPFVHVTMCRDVFIIRRQHHEHKEFFLSDILPGWSLVCLTGRVLCLRHLIANLPCEDFVARSSISGWDK